MRIMLIFNFIRIFWEMCKGSYIIKGKVSGTKYLFILKDNDPSYVYIFKDGMIVNKRYEKI